MLQADFVLNNVHQLVTMAPQSHPAATGPLGVIPRAAIAARDGKIIWVGTRDELRREVHLEPGGVVLDTHGRTVLPGFVDAHTHPVFAGHRAADFYGRISGATYAAQLQSGGIMDTVRATRAASSDVLLGLAFARAERFLQYGTTTIGGRSGYGLTLESELKLLDTLNTLQRISPLKVVPIFLGAHVVPSDWTGDADSFVDEIINEWLPAARRCSEIVDVWCDDGAFSALQCRRIMDRALALGFKLTAHASELGPSGGVLLAAERGALSVDHAVYLTDADIAALAAARTIPVLLPGTTFFLGSDRFAPARVLTDAGVPIALGTDFNPGTSNTQNMQFILTLAVMKLGMGVDDALLGATLNGARALGMEECVGSIEPGKYCDLSVLGVHDYHEIPYHVAMNLVETVVAGGRVVVQDGRILQGRGGGALPT